MNPVLVTVPDFFQDKKEITGEAASKELEIKGTVQNELGNMRATNGDLMEEVKKAVKPK